MPNFAVKEKPAAIVAPIREPLSKVSDGTALNHYYHRSKTDSLEDVTAPGYFNWMRDTFRSGFKKGVIHYVSVHLGEIAYRTRGRLDFDPTTEQFVDCDEANAMLSKNYRQPYTLPSIA